MSEDVYAVTPDEVVWCDLRDHNERTIGHLGLLKASTLGTPQYVDGWRTHKVAPIVEVDGRYIDPRSDHNLFWHVQLDVPDYPRDGAVALLMSPNDARAIARDLIALADESDRLMVKAERKEDRRLRETLEHKALAETRTTVACTIDGCRRARHFFDADGNGYCKRHADELGLRPHGKVI